MSAFELDRLFGMALTDARFFQHLRKQPHQAVACFQLTDLEAQAVIDIASVVNSIEDLAAHLDLWMARQEIETSEIQVGTLRIKPDASARQLTKDRLLNRVSQQTSYLSTHDASEVVIQLVSQEYA